MLCFLRSFESTYTSLYRAISNHSVFYLCVGLSVVEWTNTCLPLRSWLVVRGNQCSHEKLCRVRCVCVCVCACACACACACVSEVPTKSLLGSVCVWCAVCVVCCVCVWCSVCGWCSVCVVRCVCVWYCVCVWWCAVCVCM